MANSAFSVLPYHMVQLVAKYVSHPESEPDMDYSGKIPVSPLVVLLHVCHNWRQVTLPMMFGSGTIGTSKRYKYNTVYACYRDSILKCIDQTYNAYMRKMFIDVELCDATNGKTLSQLSASNVGSFVFSSLKHLNLGVRHIQETQLECPGANSNICSLVRHICQMLPALESVTLKYTSIFISMDIDVNTHHHKSNLADELSKTLSDLYLNNNTLLGNRTDCSILVANLTSLLITWDDNYKTLANILYVNSQSLQKLHISYCTFEKIEKLVHCDNPQQKYMCYPQLVELKLSGVDFTPENLVPPTDIAVVFPRLCKVDISFNYPFSDDVLFRGNRWTLEYINITLNIQAMMQLGLDGVFNKGNMLALQDVGIFNEDETAFNASINSCTINFFRGLLLSSQYVIIHSQPHCDILIGSIDCKTQHHNLVCLKLFCANVTFENIEVLLQALPRLSYLNSAISSLGNAYSGMSLAKILKHMQSKFNPLSKSLNTWSVYNMDPTLVDLVSICIILLLDQCPNFQTAVFCGGGRKNPIKIHQQLMRIIPRIAKLNVRNLENPKFNILFPQCYAVIKMYR